MPVYDFTFLDGNARPTQSRGSITVQAAVFAGAVGAIPLQFVDPRISDFNFRMAAPGQPTVTFTKAQVGAAAQGGVVLDPTSRFMLGVDGDPSNAPTDTAARAERATLTQLSAGAGQDVLTLRIWQDPGGAGLPGLWTMTWGNGMSQEGMCSVQLFG